jgi:hypothetical protein
MGAIDEQDMAFVEDLEASFSMMSPIPTFHGLYHPCYYPGQGHVAM